MIQPKKILTPTDFSETAERANRKAIAIAAQSGAEVVFVHVLEDTDKPTRHVMKHRSFPNLEDEIRKGAEREFKEFKERVAGDSVVSKCIVRNGIPSIEIAECAREEGADLIVIGTHGYGRIRKFLLGSTAERLMRIAPCSVLLVREGDEDAPD